MSDARARLRHLPKIDEVLQRAEVQALQAPRWAVVEAVRRQVAALRADIMAGRSTSVAVDLRALETQVAELVRPSLRRVVNATGVVLHTNMGRAPLAPEAAERALALAAGYSNLEYDVAAGRRGSRHGHVTELLRQLAGAEDAVAVNNCAGAVMLTLAALAHGREVIVSRGELIEIGGSFRVPDVMRMSGGHLVEVGTTNKTRLRDYEAAITERTALLLKVHRSNFAIVGFTEEAPLGELAALARGRGLLSMMDLGSGSFLDEAEQRELGLPAEPSVRQVVASGVDVVCFSGDKLLGGPQAGIIAGRSEVVERVRRHPMMRTLRPDKLTIAALEATLSLYRDGKARATVPALVMLGADREALRARAERLRELAGEPDAVDVELVACESTVGGGAMPTASLPSWGLALVPREGMSLGAIDEGLRAASPPVVGRMIDDRMLLDVRTLAAEGELELVAAAIHGLKAPAA